MVQKIERERIQTLVKDTLTLLCKNGLTFKAEFSIEALIGITLDHEDVLLININEIIKSAAAEKLEEYNEAQEEEDGSEAEQQEQGDSDSSHSYKSRKRKHRRYEKKSTDEDSDGQDSVPETKTVRMHERHKKATSTVTTGFIKQDEEGSDEDDIVVIKEEKGDEWLQYSSPGTSNTNTGSQDANYLQNQDFSTSSLSEMTLLPVGAQEGNMWSQDLAAHQYGSDMSQIAAMQLQGAAGDSSQQMKKPFKCPICGKMIQTRWSLSRHIGLHQGKFQHYCPDCNKGFSSSSTLKGHMSWHTGVKEFKCPNCERCFRYKGELRTHLQSTCTKDYTS